MITILLINGSMNSVYKLVHTNTWSRLITVREFVSAPKNWSARRITIYYAKYQVSAMWMKVCR